MTNAETMLETTQHKARILLIDDDPISLKAVASFLSKSYQILVAINGTQGLEAAKQHPHPDLIILDIEMPGMDGFELCRKLKFSALTRDIPIIFVTSRESDDDERIGLELGAVDFITKPVKADILQVRIRTQIQLQLQRKMLLDSESLLKATLNSTRDAIALWRNNNEPCLLNGKFAEMWLDNDTSPQSLTTSNLDTISQQLIDGDKWSATMQQLLLDNHPDERLLECLDGRYISQYSLPVLEDSGIEGRVFSFSDVTSQVRLEQKLRHLSITDALTGLRNRRELLSILERETNRANRYQHDLGIIAADIDHFKKINDNYGHEQGDKVLVAVADLIKKSVRNSDYAFRAGGEEFLIVVSQTNQQHLLETAERLRNALDQLRIDGIHCTLSVGLALLSQLPLHASSERLLAMADVQLYRAKESGRNQVCITDAG